MAPENPDQNEQLADADRDDVALSDHPQSNRIHAPTLIIGMVIVLAVLIVVVLLFASGS